MEEGLSSRNPVSPSFSWCCCWFGLSACLSGVEFKNVLSKSNREKTEKKEPIHAHETKIEIEERLRGSESEASNLFVSEFASL